MYLYKKNNFDPNTDTFVLKKNLDIVYRQIFFLSNVFKEINIHYIAILPTFWTVSKKVFVVVETF